MPQCSRLMRLHKYFCVTHAYRRGHLYGIPASVCVCAYFEFATECTCVGPVCIDIPTCVCIGTRLYFTCMHFSRCTYLHLCMCLSLWVLHADIQIYLHMYTGIWCACVGISRCDSLCFSIHVDSVPAGPRGPSLHTRATVHAPPHLHPHNALCALTTLHIVPPCKLITCGVLKAKEMSDPGCGLHGTCIVFWV